MSKINNFIKYLYLLFFILLPYIVSLSLTNNTGKTVISLLNGITFKANIIWILIFIFVILILVLELITRISLVTGKSLSSLIRENYGLKVSFWICLVLFITSILNISCELKGIILSLSIFNVNQFIVIPILIIILWIVILKTNYKLIKYTFFVICLGFLLFFIALFYSKVEFFSIIKQSTNYLLLWDYKTYALIGSVAMPFSILYVQMYISEKFFNIKHFVYFKIFIILSSLINLAITFSIILLSSNYLSSDIKNFDIFYISKILTPLLSEFFPYIFSLLLFSGSLFVILIIPVLTANYICEAFGVETGPTTDFKDAPEFYTIFSLLLILGTIISLFNIDLLFLTSITQIVNTSILPFLFIFLILITNNKELMENYVNNKYYNFILWLVTITLFVSILTCCKYDVT